MKILFMCVANSARSQLAEGIAKSLMPEAEIRSAGSEPTRVNPMAIEVLKEIGIDISKNTSKFYDDHPPGFLASMDYVITLCAEEVCPRVPSKARKLHWPFPDPATKEPISREESLKRFREARDGIIKKLGEFKKEIGS